MINPSDLEWDAVSGIDSDGASIRQRLNELAAGALPYDEQIEVLVDLCRDGVASTAGYAAIPLLVFPDCRDVRTRWEMVRTAGLIVSSVGRSGSPPVPDHLMSNVDESARLQIKTAILKTAAEAELGAAELVDTLSVAVAMVGREDLADTLAEIALREYGVT
jgi:hypothetical protein